MLVIGIKSASAMSAPIRGFDKWCTFNQLDIGNAPSCEWFRHTRRGFNSLAGLEFRCGIQESLSLEV